MLAIIPAKGFSVRLPRKNFLLCNGKSLLARAIECAREAQIFERVWVTSEDLEAESITHDIGARYRFSPRRVHVSTVAVVFDLLCFLRYIPDSFCVLNPTTPTRTARLLLEVNDEFLRSNVDCLMTGEKPHHDGAALFCKTDAFLKTLDFHRIENTCWLKLHSKQVDINTQEDFNRAESWLIAREGDRQWMDGTWFLL